MDNDFFNKFWMLSFGIIAERIIEQSCGTMLCDFFDEMYD
jgi:hypothetical protein